MKRVVPGAKSKKRERVARKRAKEGGEREKSFVHRLGPLRGLMNAGVAAGDSRCRQTGRTWSRSLSLFCALFHYRLPVPRYFFFFSCFAKREREKERETKKRRKKRTDDFNDVVLRFTGSASKRKTTVGARGGEGGCRGRKS